MKAIAQKTFLLVVFATFFLSVSAFGMEHPHRAKPPATTGSPQKISGPSKVKYLLLLSVEVAKNACFAYLTSQVLNPVCTRLDDSLFSGAGYCAPCVLALGSLWLQQLAAYEARASELRSGKPGIWSRVKSIAASARNILVGNCIARGLGSILSPWYQSTGSHIAAACSEMGLGTQTCSVVADKALITGVTAVTTAAANGVEHLCSDPDTFQPRVRKSTLTPQAAAPATAVADAPDVPATGISAGGITLQGPQIFYFLVRHGCDPEKLWHCWLSQTAHVKAFGDGNWQQFCATQLLHLHKSIMAAFATASKKLPATMTSVTNLIDPYMPFSQYPAQFTCDQTYRAKESPSFSVTVAKDPKEIFDGICNAVLSYFDPENLQIRNKKGDEALFNCPLTLVVFQVTATNVTITAYPQSRQDLLYPLQWETPIELPRWLRVVNATIPYAITAVKIIIAPSSGHFLPEGMCTVRDGHMYCHSSDTPSVIFSQPTDCATPAVCVAEAEKLMHAYQPQPITWSGSLPDGHQAECRLTSSPLAGFDAQPDTEFACMAIAPNGTRYAVCVTYAPIWDTRQVQPLSSSTALMLLDHQPSDVHADVHEPTSRVLLAQPMKRLGTSLEELRIEVPKGETPRVQRRIITLDSFGHPNTWESSTETPPVQISLIGNHLVIGDGSIRIPSIRIPLVIQQSI